MALNTGHSLYANIVQAHKADDALPKLVDQIGSSDIAGQTYHWHKDDIVQASITPQQGIARNATHWFSSSSSVIKKYDLTGTEVASNSSPYTGLSGTPDHIGDGYVDGSYYYLPVCDYDSATETATDVQIVRYNISDLSLDGYWDVSGNGFFGAGLSLSIDGTEIVGTNYNASGSNTLYRFNKTTGAYIGTHTLTDTIKGTQGISTDGTDYYISSHDTTAGRNIIYRVDSSFNTINKITPVTVSNTTTYEGEGVECYGGKLYFHTINAAIRELTPLTLYIDSGLGSPQQFMTTPADTGTILMRVTPRTFFNYNSIIDNNVTANDWEAWVYATGQLSWRVDATFKCDYTLPSADQEYIVAFTWEKSGSNVTIKLGVDGTYRSTQTGVWQTAPSALWLAGKNPSNNQGNNIYRDIFVFDKVLSDAELSDTYTNFDNLYATPGGTYTVTGSLSAVLQKQGIARQATLNAILQKQGLTLNSSVDALLQKSVDITGEIDAILKKLGITSVSSIDALLQKRGSVSSSLDAILTALTAGETTASIDAILKKLGITNAASLDSILQKQGVNVSASLSALLQKAVSLSSVMDAILQKTVTTSASLDAILTAIGSGTLSANFDAILRKTLAVNLSIDALLQKKDLTVYASIDALLSKRQTTAATLDAILYGSASIAASLDALLKRTGVTITANLDAILTLSGSFITPKNLIYVMAEDRIVTVLAEDRTVKVI